MFATSRSRLNGRITKVVRRDDTLKRYGGYGDCFHMTWGADDRQYAAVNDGLGWFENPGGEWFYNTRLWAIDGGPLDATFHDIAGYPVLTPSPYGRSQAPRYYGFGTISVAGCFYQFLSTWNRMLPTPDDPQASGVRFVGSKLIYSPDHGRTWCNQDGSSPVAWEPWDGRTKKTMIFLDEPQEAFSLISILQMGRDYCDNTDGYVYLYSPNGNAEGSMNELVMLRVLKDRILERNAYEYFGGFKRDGAPRWERDIALRSVVFTFPSGWVGTKVHPFSWIPSIVYVAPLGLYMMANWGTGNDAQGTWFQKPSYLGLWIAQMPWGPWTQIHEETAWTPGDRPTSRAYMPQIAPKWIAPDGRWFWLVWTDYEYDPTPAAEVEKLSKKADLTIEDHHRMMGLLRECAPYYAFNAQRIDLILE